MPSKKQVCGFVISEDKKHILLARRTSPPSWVNMLHGIVADLPYAIPVTTTEGEEAPPAPPTAQEIMSQAARAEMGVYVAPEAWELRAVLVNPLDLSEMHVYRGFGQPQTATKQGQHLPATFPLHTTDFNREPVCPHLKWLLPLVREGQLAEPPVIKVV